MAFWKLEFFSKGTKLNNSIAQYTTYVNQFDSKTSGILRDLFISYNSIYMREKSFFWK